MSNRMITILGSLLLAVFLATPAGAQDVRIGWSAWADAEFVAKLSEEILSSRMGQDVELIQTDIAPQYQGVANGDIDVMVMAWLPDTHADYMDSVGPDLVSLGILYGYARLGWAVPEYIPESELSSIEDLKDPEVRKKLDGTITGIDPGAGLTRLSKDALDTYGLDDYNLLISSESGMMAALDRAVKRDNWVVVTAWSPHWMFGAYELRYLDDPEGALGQHERVHAMARKGFYQDNIEAALFLSRLYIDIDVLQEYMYKAQETSYEQAVAEFMDDNPELIDYWVNGELD